MNIKNQLRITQTCRTICELMQIAAPSNADEANEAVLAKARMVFAGKPVEKVLLYNPDAIALWLYQKYTDLFLPVLARCDLALPIQSVMPSVTPVCFASMYSGLEPKDHGIQSYVKPVLQCETLFDALLAGNKKVVIVSTRGDSITEIFKGRDMDYVECDTADECNDKVIEALQSNQYDVVLCYNANYDTIMHANGPEAAISLAQIEHNAKAFARLTDCANEVWKEYNHVSAFLPDHGCHEIDHHLGDHGLDMEEDMHIIHFYKMNK